MMPGEILKYSIVSQLLLTDEFPVANPTKHGRNYFVRQLHYAAGEVRNYTPHFPLHRTGDRGGPAVGLIEKL